MLSFPFVYILNKKKDGSLYLHLKFMAFCLPFPAGMRAIFKIFEFTVNQFRLDYAEEWPHRYDTEPHRRLRILKARDSDSFLEKWINSFIEKNPTYSAWEKINLLTNTILPLVFNSSLEMVTRRGGDLFTP